MYTCKYHSSDLSLLDDTLKEYQCLPEALITILQKAQDIYGYLPLDVIYHVANRIGVSPARVLGVATFYSQFRLQPIGKYLIMLCQGTACHVNGVEKIRDAICEELKISDGETTSDGLFTLKSVACLGCCSLSPAMMINDETFGSLTPEKAIGILNDIRTRQEGDIK